MRQFVPAEIWEIPLGPREVPEGIERDLEFCKMIDAGQQFAKEGIGNGRQAGCARREAIESAHISGAGSASRNRGGAAFSNFASDSRNTSSTVPTGPLRCLATMISAIFFLRVSVSYWSGR